MLFKQGGPYAPKEWQDFSCIAKGAHGTPYNGSIFTDVKGIVECWFLEIIADPILSSMKCDACFRGDNYSNAA